MLITKRATFNAVVAIFDFSPENELFLVSVLLFFLPFPFYSYNHALLPSPLAPLSSPSHPAVMMHRPRFSPAGHSARAGGEQPSEGAAFAEMRWGTAPLPGRGGSSPLLFHSSAVAPGPRRQLLGAADFPSARLASALPAASLRRQPPSATPMPGGARPLPSAGGGPCPALPSAAGRAHSA